MPQPCDPGSGFEGFCVPLEHALPRMSSPCAAGIWLTGHVAKGLQRKLKVQWRGVQTTDLFQNYPGERSCFSAGNVVTLTSVPRPFMLCF